MSKVFEYIYNLDIKDRNNRWGSLFPLSIEDFTVCNEALYKQLMELKKVCIDRDNE